MDYTHYHDRVREINSELIEDSTFKSNPLYNSILEHVSYELGQQYIDCIVREYPHVTFDEIDGFLSMNDSLGAPKRYSYTIYGKAVECSSTSLRYIYHALHILSYYRDTGCKRMVEVGCGYGGLFLAFNYFSGILKVEIESYAMVDLPEVRTLITNYLNKHSSNIHIPYTLHDAGRFGKDVYCEDAFFVSNYCFTELPMELRTQYMIQLIGRLDRGFITWQTGFDYVPIEQVSFCKPLRKVEEERPQTAVEYKNWFVYF